MAPGAGKTDYTIMLYNITLFPGLKYTKPVYNFTLSIIVKHYFYPLFNVKIYFSSV